MYLHANVYKVYITFGAFPFGYMNRLSIIASSLFLFGSGVKQAVWFSIPKMLTSSGHSPRCDDDSSAPPHIRHVRSLSGKRLYVPTRHRFPDRNNTCRICGEADESSTHLGECPGITKILDALNKVARFSPKTERSREDTIIDSLFIFPRGEAPKAIYALYLLAWRYIITDFYRIHYDGVDV